MVLVNKVSFKNMYSLLWPRLLKMQVTFHFVLPSSSSLILKNNFVFNFFFLFIEKHDMVLDKVPSRYQSRWFGGWTWKVNLIFFGHHLLAQYSLVNYS